MKFISTRGGDECVSGAEAVVKGIADNGGLFVPSVFPRVSDGELSDMLDWSYAERAAFILGKFFDEYDKDGLLEACKEAEGKFEDRDPAPIVRLDEGVYVLELFHGPTCAFKDLALTMLPYLLKTGCELCGIKEDIMVVVATSGDTGKAALEGFKDKEGMKVCVFYPADGVSKMQKLQMCTQEGGNVDVIGVRGNFDDCQTAVKKLFSDENVKTALKEKNIRLSSANSINFGRLAPQIAYYFSAYADLISSDQIKIGSAVDFCVPTGNFGNILAGYYAKRMGLPIRRLHCASNSNNVLTEFLAKGEYNSKRELFKTTSPSMDILVSSNLERLLFEISDRNGALIASRMKELETTGRYSITPAERERIAKDFNGGFADEDECVEAIYNLYMDTGYTLDTHTGCAMKVAADWFEKNKKDTTPMILVSTASPYKFPQDVLYAVTGNDVKDSFKGIKRLHAATAMTVPKTLQALKDKPVRFDESINEDEIFSAVSAFADGVCHETKT